MEVAKLIKGSREILGLTQKELAKKLGFSDQFLGKIEKGLVSLPLKSARKIIKSLGFSYDNLIDALVTDYENKIKKILLK